MTGRWVTRNFSIRCDRGNVAIIFAAAALVIIGVIGLALDFSRASDLRTRLQSAADFAVLNALNPRNTGGDLVQQAEAFFISSLASEDAATVTSKKASLEREPTGEPRALKLDFTADMPSSLLQAVGVPALAIASTASTVVGADYSARLHFLVDTSDSMGIAATEAARSQLIYATRDEPRGGCEFACHSSDRLEIARDNNITLRVDVAKRGAERVVELAREFTAKGSEFAFSLHAIGTRAENIVTLTKDQSEILAGIEKLEVGYGHKSGDDADTFFNLSIPQAASWLDSIGINSMLDVVILVTDGVQSKNNSDRPIVRPIDQQYCDLLKRGGRRVAVVYTEYLPIPTDHAYFVTVAEFQDQLEPNLRACASSPELFGKGSSPEEIVRAFENVFMALKRTTVRLAR
jgi:Flp pilus assembly protein TadG